MTVTGSRGADSGPRGQYKLLRSVKGSSGLLGRKLRSVNSSCCVLLKKEFIFVLYLRENGEKRKNTGESDVQKPC